MNKKRLNALINLLDDPDSIVFQTVKKELQNETDFIIPALEAKWESSTNEICQQRIETLIKDLHFKKTKKIFESWVYSNEHNLLKGFVTIDRINFPDIKEQIIKKKIESIKKSIWLEFNNSLTLLEKITILNHFLFNIYEFTYNKKNHPKNCFLNHLLNTKVGNSTSLCLFYIIIARQLKLPVYFIDFPKKPLAAVVDKNLAKQVHGKNTKTNIIFYINPSNKGAITSKKEVEYHLMKNNYPPDIKFTEPADDSLLIFRLLESLFSAYYNNGITEQTKKVKELLRLFNFN